MKNTNIRKYWLSETVIKKLQDKSRINKEDPTLTEPLARIFNACGSESWELAWVEPCGDIAYGWVNWLEREFGPFSIKELKDIPYRFGRAMLEIDMMYPNSRSIEK